MDKSTLDVESLVAAVSTGKVAGTELGLMLLGGAAHPSRRPTGAEREGLG
jgi:hypothetical protein